ncbi:putative nicotinate-nucleotide adenylyltransferase [Shewanella sp. NFH-SH190041]|uniref:nicotinate (nicotinamide) nucleotide adenylyltransferase n=1 Tax=Shewanella sp. NFH-SH190041 TaxID=2950245 RepID=UPI0021C292EA|nr:nicotinate (nicotinamide) nucleotide adenylyltransferase [Shewanella sp. NFH-SH190041]BDM65650.1 putative nicotinate-nucleotide adenylyltransferase [Shewanella sp. NFH-SH190041]
MSTPQHSLPIARPRQLVGLLGGTFDPIHFGHIRPALAAAAVLGLEQIWLMPNAIPPHKNGAITATEHRMAMAKQVCHEFPLFKLCDLEVALAASGKPSYSVNTLTELNRRYPNLNFVFLMGMDSLITLPQWHQWQTLLTLCNFAVCRRPGWPLPECLPDTICQRITDHLSPDKHGQIVLLNVDEQAISSTDIRTMLRSGNFPENLMPKAVNHYIRSHGLYLG